MGRATLFLIVISFVVGCDALPPRWDQVTGHRRSPEHLVQLDLDPVRYAVATEAGILCLAEDALRIADVPFRYRFGRGVFADRAKVDRFTNYLGILTPESSRLPEARLGLYPARNDDDLIIGIRDEEGLAESVGVELWQDGELGDLIEFSLDADEARDFIEKFTGAGLYAWRDEHYQLVGLLNGVYVVDEPVAAFVGLDEMVRILPTGSTFFERRLRVLRPDFEYGVIDRPGPMAPDVR